MHLQPIVDVETQFIISDNATNVVKKTVKLSYLWMYQDINTFQANLSITSNQILEYSSYKAIPGKLLFCYVAENDAALSFQKFKDECMNKYNNTDNSTMGWTIVSNSNIQPDQNLELLKMINREFN